MSPRTKLSSMKRWMEDPMLSVVDKQDSDYDPYQVLSDSMETLTLSLPEFEKYAIIEQAYIAALLLNKMDVATTYFCQLEDRFKKIDSKRLILLKGIGLEAQGLLKEAIQLYRALLEEDETNMKVKKRLISALISQDNIEGAIEHLVGYVDNFMQDVDAWVQLAELYFSQSMFQQSAYCYEEAILLRPMVHLYHILYARVKYVQEKYQLALKHYSRALDLCEDDTDALFGIRQCTRRLLAAISTQNKENNLVLETTETKETLTSLLQLANDRLSALYQEKAISSHQNKVIHALYEKKNQQLNEKH